MNRRRCLLAWLPPALFTACTTFETFEVDYFPGTERYEVSRVTREDGSLEKYVLQVGQANGDATLEVITEYDRERGCLGLEVVDLDRAEAERRGVKPYQGVLVTGILPRSAAAAAGVLAGDVLLAVDAQATVYADQLPAVEGRLRPFRAVPAKLLRGQAELEVQIEPVAKKERVADAQPIPLDAPPPQKPYAGVVMRGIPRAWAERMFADRRNGVLLASVEVGSPAWVAGFRAGDVLEAVDGGPVPELAELARLIADRGEQQQEVTLRTRRGAADRHEAAVELGDYRASRQVWLPLVFRVRDGAAEDRWSAGPFGMIANNRSRYVSGSHRRGPQTQNVFNALLGAFRLEEGPHETNLRLLWIIDIDL